MVCFLLSFSFYSILRLQALSVAHRKGTKAGGKAEGEAGEIKEKEMIARRYRGDH